MTLFEGGLAHIYGSSLGALKRALDSLLAAGHIAVAHSEPGPRGRKTYTITEQGRAEFARWMRSPIDGGDVETTALARTFLLGVLPESERTEVLDVVVEAVTDQLARLQRLEARLGTVEVPDELRDIFAHQVATLEYGIGAATFARDWFTAHRDRVRASAAEGAE